MAGHRDRNTSFSRGAFDIERSRPVVIGVADRGNADTGLPNEFEKRVKRRVGYDRARAVVPVDSEESGGGSLDANVRSRLYRTGLEPLRVNRNPCDTVGAMAAQVRVDHGFGYDRGIVFGDTDRNENPVRKVADRVQGQFRHDRASPFVRS